MIMNMKQRKLKIEPRINLNYDIYTICAYHILNGLPCYISNTIIICAVRGYNLSIPREAFIEHYTKILVFRHTVDLNCHSNIVFSLLFCRFACRQSLECLLTSQGKAKLYLINVMASFPVCNENKFVNSGFPCPSVRRF